MNQRWRMEMYLVAIRFKFPTVTLLIGLILFELGVGWTLHSRRPRSRRRIHQTNDNQCSHTPTVLHESILSSHHDGIDDSYDISNTKSSSSKRYNNNKDISSSSSSKHIPNKSLQQQIHTPTRTKFNQITKTQSLGMNKKSDVKLSSHEINSLLQEMGLTPVYKSNISATSNNTNTNTWRKQQQQQKDDKSNTSSFIFSSSSSSSSLLSTTLSIETQLQYSRNGHAVIRNLFSSEYLFQLKKDLIEFSNQSKLKAYQQKVEVFTKSSSIASSCHTIEECIQILSSSTSSSSTSFPFLQYFNTWKSIPSVRRLVTSYQLAQVAATLMDVPSIKLYQDSLFHKRIQDKPTPWHSDGRMIPLDTSNMITFWIPLMDIPHPKDGGTGLYFVDKSHSDFALPFWNSVMDYETINQKEEEEENKSKVQTKNVKVKRKIHHPHLLHDEYQRLEQRYGGEKHCIKHYMPMNMGDVTVHSGWTLHCTSGKTIGQEEEEEDIEKNHHALNKNWVGEDRYALAVSYVDARAQVRHGAWEELVESNHTDSKESSRKGYNEDRWSFQEWLKDVKPRKYFEHELVPIVWPQKKNVFIK